MGNHGCHGLVVAVSGCRFPAPLEVWPVLCTVDGHILVPAVKQQPVLVEQLIRHRRHKVRDAGLQYKLMIMTGNAERVVLYAAHMAHIIINALLASGSSVRHQPLMAQQEEPRLPLAELVGYHRYHLIQYYVLPTIIQNKCSEFKHKKPPEA